MNRPHYKKMYYEELYWKNNYRDFVIRLLSILESEKILKYSIEQNDFSFDYVLKLETLSQNKMFIELLLDDKFI